MGSGTLKILTLDGGGSKGIFSLGVLFEIEAKLKQPLNQYFDCFYGTSTGAIIAASLSLGKSIEEIKSLYFKKVPRIMGHCSKRCRTNELKKVLEEEFGNKTFKDCKKYLGVITSSLDDRKPKVFKSSVDGAHGLKATFTPGFGFTIAEAVFASCSATPFFEKVKLRSLDGNYNFTLIDGGFSANNPTLFSLIDAIKAFGKDEADILIVNVGTGSFPHKTSFSFLMTDCLNRITQHFIPDIMEINANTTGVIAEMLFKNVKILRIDKTFTHPSLKTNFLENDVGKLEKIFGQGRVTFGEFEQRFDQIIK